MTEVVDLYARKFAREGSVKLCYRESVSRSVGNKAPNPVFFETVNILCK